MLRATVFVCWSQQHASVSQGRICSDNFTCHHTEIEAADHTFYLTQSQYTDTGPTSPSADPIMPGAWKDSHWSASFEVTGMTRPGKIPSQAGFEPRIFLSRGGCLNQYDSEAVCHCVRFYPATHLYYMPATLCAVVNGHCQTTILYRVPVCNTTQWPSYAIVCDLIFLSYLSRLADRWGTTVDFTTSFPDLLAVLGFP